MGVINFLILMTDCSPQWHLVANVTEVCMIKPKKATAVAESLIKILKVLF